MADDNDTPTTGDTTDPDAGAKKALQAERERARKAEADAKAAREELAKLKADSDSKKSEIDRALDRIKELEDRAAAADLRALKAEVASAKGLTAAQAKRLTGTTLEELERDADELLEAFKPSGKSNDDDDKGGRQAGRQREALRGGATPPADTGGDTFDENKFLAAVPRG